MELSEKTKIVIIDDEQDLCFLLSGMLKTYGFDVKSFYNLKSGIDGLKQFRPHWVIMDNNLPDGLGWDETGRILNEAPGINIINISANPDSLRTDHGPRVHYLIKPISAESIVNLINAD